MIYMNLQIFGGRGGKSNQGTGTPVGDDERTGQGEPENQDKLPEELKGRITPEEFMGYNDDETDDFLEFVSADKSLIRDDEFDSQTQRVINALGVHGAPEVVDEEKFEELFEKYYSKNLNDPEAMIMYRTVNGNQYMSSFEVAEQIIRDTHNNIGGWGGQAYGGGMYFSDNYRGSRLGYGGRDPYTIAAFMNPTKTRMIHEDDLRKKYKEYCKTNPKAAAKFGNPNFNMLGTRGMSTFAMKLGYNAIRRSVSKDEQYITVIDKSILITTNQDEKSGFKYHYLKKKGEMIWQRSVN